MESRRKWIRDDGTDGEPSMQRLMTCVECGVTKLCNTSNFRANNVPATGGINAWLERYDPGAESFSNSVGHPCNACWADKLQRIRSTPHGRQRHIAGKYTQHPPEWFEEQKQLILKTHCPLTGAPGSLMEETQNSQWSMGVNEILPGRAAGVAYAQTHHAPENCELVFACANIRQGDIGMRVLRDQGMRCAISKSLLTVKAGGKTMLMTQVSFDRLDNSKPHFAPGNTRAVCIIFKTNNHYVMSPKRFAFMAAHNRFDVVQPTDAQLDAIRALLAAMPYEPVWEAHARAWEATQERRMLPPQEAC